MNRDETKKAKTNLEILVEIAKEQLPSPEEQNELFLKQLERDVRLDKLIFGPNR